MFDPAAFGEAMAEEIRKACEPLIAAVKDLKAQVEMLEQKAALPRKDGDKGDPGKDCDMDAVERRIRELVEAMPTPRDGKDCDMNMVHEQVDRYLSQLPKPENGKDCDMDAVEQHIKRMISEIPTPKDGENGLGLAGSMIDRDGNLIITMTNGEAKNLGLVVGRDGLDGLSLEAFGIEYIEESHEIRITASAAGREKQITYPAGGISHGGYWREGTNAKALSLWSQDGSLWMATKSTRTKPSTDKDSDWMIVARKGRDGQDGKTPIDPNKTVKID